MTSPGTNVTVSRDDLKQIMREAVEAVPAKNPPILPVSEIEDLIARGVKSAFTQIGIDTKNPLQMQADFSFVRSTRKAWRAAVATAQGTAIAAIVTGVCTVLWLGFKASISGK